MSDGVKEAGAGGAQPRTEHEREALRLLDVAVQATGGQHRAGQREMVLQVARALESRRHLLVQAGTGTGKSLAYLIPDFQNPTGHLMTEAQRRTYARHLRATGAVAVVDEAHKVGQPGTGVLAASSPGVTIQQDTVTIPPAAFAVIETRAPGPGNPGA